MQDHNGAEQSLGQLIKLMKLQAIQHFEMSSMMDHSSWHLLTLMQRLM